MRNILVVVILFLSGCSTHSSINHLYPEFVGNDVVSTSEMYLTLSQDNYQSDHPKYKLHFYKPAVVSETEYIVVTKNSILSISGFLEHKRFTEYGTEVHGYIVIKRRRYNFYKTISMYQDKKAKMLLPWSVVN